MVPKRIKVIKRDQIKIDGTIELSPCAAGVLPLSGRQSIPSEAVPQQARIVQTSPDFAVLEVVCGCGCKSHIQCHY